MRILNSTEAVLREVAGEWAYADEFAWILKCRKTRPAGEGLQVGAPPVEASAGDSRPPSRGVKGEELP